MVWLSQEKEATQKLIKETILQLCRVNFDLGGSMTYEIDGIICITARSATSVTDDDQLVVKLHERIARSYGDYYLGSHGHNDRTGLSLVTTNNSLDFCERGDSASSLLRGYLSGPRSAAGSSGASSLNMVLDHRALVTQTQISDNKRKATDENDNPVYLSAKRSSSSFGSVLKTNKDRRNISVAKPSERSVVPLNREGYESALDLHVPTSSRSVDKDGAQPSDYSCSKSAHCVASRDESMNSHETTLPRKIKVEQILADEDQADEGAANDSANSLAPSRRKQSFPKRGVVTDSSSELQGKDFTSDTEEKIKTSEDSDGQSSLNGFVVQKDHQTVAVVDRQETSLNSLTETMPIDTGLEATTGTDLIRSLLQKQSAARNGIVLNYATKSGISAVGSKSPATNQSIGRNSLPHSSALRVRLKQGAAGRIVAATVRGGSELSEGSGHGKVVRVKVGKGGVDASGEWKCAHCDVVLQGFQSYANHCRTTHKRHACPYCLQTFTQRVNRDRHLYNHTGEKPYDCAECGYGFTRRDALRKHQLRTRHSLSTVESLDSVPGVPSHSILASSSPSPANQPSASFCVDGDKSQEEDDEENDMMVQWDTEDNVGDDDEMGLDLSMTSSVVTPGKSQATLSRSHRGVAQKKVRSAHDEIEGWCVRNLPSDDESSPMRSSGGSGTKNLLSLSQDLPSSGSNASMSASRRGFRPAGVLNENDSGDQSQRSFRCDVCGKTTKGIAEFTEHCKTQHRRTPCVFCGRTFSQKGNMERHMRQHTGERPFRCESCGSSYTRKETLKAHMMQAHGEATEARASSVGAVMAEDDIEANVHNRVNDDDGSPASTAGSPLGSVVIKSELTLNDEVFHREKAASEEETGIDNQDVKGLAVSQDDEMSVSTDELSSVEDSAMKTSKVVSCRETVDSDESKQSDYEKADNVVADLNTTASKP